MKWYLQVLALLILWAPLLGAEETLETPLTLEKALIVDREPDSKDPNRKSQIPPAQPTPSPSPEQQQLPPQDSETKRATESYESAFVKTITVLVALLILILLTFWMFKKLSQGRLHSLNHLKSIKILEKRPLSPKSMLYLIEVNSKQILLTESQIDVKPITSFDQIKVDRDL